MSLQSDTNNDIFIIPSQSLMQFSGSEASPIVLYVEPSGAVNFVGTTGSILKIMDNLSGSLFSVNNISGLSILEVFSNNQVKIGNPANYALVVSGSNVIITGSLIDKSSGTKFLVVDTTTGVVYTTGSGGGGGSPTSPASPVNSIQYNNAGAFGAVATLTYDGTTLRATGSFTGSLTGSLFGTASWAQSASQATSASYVYISSSNTATLEVSYTTPGVIALLAKTGSGGTTPQGSSTQLQYNDGGNFGGVASSSFNNGTKQLTLGNLIATGSLLGTASFATSASFAISSSRAVSASFATSASFAISSSRAVSASFATTASYVNLVAGPRIQAVNYSGSIISITGSIGGSDTNIQFNSGSAFSGSSRFTFDYISNTARLTGSLIVTGSTTLTGSFDVFTNSNTFFNYGYSNINTGNVAAASLYVNTGTGISGSLLNIFTTNKGYQGAAPPNNNPYIEGSSLILTTPTSQPSSPDANRAIKHLVGITRTLLISSSFEWHMSTGNTLTASTRRMILTQPGLSVTGNVTTSDALYIGASGSANSWRIGPSDANLVIQKWNGSAYVGGITITPTGL